MILTRLSRRAFTLIELLVVMTILAILLGLFIGAGVRVTRNSKVSATRNILLSLDRALDEYMMANGGNIPPFVRESYAGVPGLDGPNGDPSPSAYVNDVTAMPQRPDASVFVRQARGIGDVNSVLAAIPERFLALTVAPSNLVSDPEPVLSNMTDTTPSILDAWAVEDWTSLSETGMDVSLAWPVAEQSLIYYVHPSNRRDRQNDPPERPDAQELYGACVNGRPYFLSAGPDRFYGHPSEFDAIKARYGLSQRDGESVEAFRNRVMLEARKDNLYSTPVDIEFQIRDDVFNAMGVS